MKHGTGRAVRMAFATKVQQSQWGDSGGRRSWEPAMEFLVAALLRMLWASRLRECVR